MIHTALLDLPDVLTELGFNVVALPGWESAQGDDYEWVADQPHCYMVHHTASSKATPVVKTSSGVWSKANAWIGLSTDGGATLTQYGDGDPIIVLTAAGPARVSAGYGHWPSGEIAMKDDVRSPVRALGFDGDSALNRYAFSVETVCEGRGTELARPVFDHVAGLGRALHRMFGWSERTIGHAGWTRRKTDPDWVVAGLPHSGVECIIDVQEAIAAMNRCPWTPPCVNHYTPDTSMPAGIGTGEHQGSCNVPTEMQPAIAWAFKSGMYRAGNRHRYDYLEPLSEGRYTVFEYRQQGGSQ